MPLWALRGRPRREPSTFDREVEALASQIRPLGPCRLLAYSMGARLALGLLARYPACFRNATLVGARAGLANASARLNRQRWEQTIIDELVAEPRARLSKAFALRWQDLPALRSRWLTPETQDELLSVRLSHHPLGLARAMEALGLGRMPNLRPELRRARVPIRLLVGQDDERFRADATELVGLLPSASVGIVERAGHNVLAERPDLVAAELRREAA